ncbi:MAG: NAD-glutamate dehydrogenase domain-containing protein [Pseudomonadota bacterium]
MTVTKKPHNTVHITKIAKALATDSLPGELHDFGPKARSAAAEFVLGALQQRKPGKSSIVIDTLVNESGQRQMRLAVINADMPFLVDSVAAVIASHGIVVDRLLHPIIAIVRDAGGALVELVPPDSEGSKPESIIYIETERADAKTRAEIREMIDANLIDVRHAVTDWEKLTKAMKAEAAGVADPSDGALLNWFVGNRFTLLGHVEFGEDGAAENAQGIGRTQAEYLLSNAARARAMEWFRAGNSAMLVVKSNLLSPVHRRVPLDLVIAPRRDGGKVTGLSIHAGLWTSAALGTPPQDVPYLRDRLTALQTKYKFDPSGHAGKALGHALATLPRDIMISVSADDLETLTLTAMSIADRPRPKLELVSAPLDRHLFGFVWLPRDELTTARRVAIGDMLATAASARLLNWSIELGDGEVALLRYTLDLREGGTIPATAPLNQRIEGMVRGWQPAVESSLTNIGDRGQAARLALRYAGAFPMGYRTGAGPDEAALDIVGLHSLSSETSRSVRFYRNPGDASAMLRMKLYSLGAIALSDAVPALENFGFRVMEELSTPVGGGALGHIQKFVLEAPIGSNAATIAAAPATIQRAIARVLEGLAEDDRFNQLVVELGFDLGEVTLFRALFRYLRQTGLAYGLVTVVDALRGAPTVAHAIIGLFNAHHNPAQKKARAKAADDADQAIARGLANVKGIDEDRILRLYRAVVKATLRTNAFAPAAREALAFKIDSALVPGLPAPKPWREIFVYSPRVEGIHLRAGPIARGGLRWSDRRDDFRTEILGLMKAQRVKNAVIVPTGAKGGFYPKALPTPANREAWLAEGTECYRIFIRTLLSVTDNIVEGKVVHPDAVVIHDGEDPYFVVAADKGTATFSDVANAIALERGFWLGDAFASGGSVGYDHKAMGITAKGAWVSVQRHFAESGVDVQKDEVRVVGCGDMSGDVFGNGMLLSKSLKVVAAFDHRHIFFDPDPDPAKSWKERARMFKLPRSSWEDYDKALISKGGGVFARSAKSIPLSKQVRAILDVTEAAMEPSALIAAILKSPADLIWFGGIGTYVKAKSESNGEVGDRANDAHRINADELRAKVIGEGANLGVTQAARIDFALRGGRVNTDFIDNSAGVDCSDNEVNIKIALGAEIARGALTMPNRDKLLASMTSDVGALVLEDNRLQTLALSIAERGGAAALPLLTRLIEIFEAEGRLDRAVEGLASNDELLRRAQSGQGLTRPELAVLLATAKLWLQDAIEGVDTSDDAILAAGLSAAFPTAMQKNHAQAIETHQLRSQIIATKLANRMVNRMGLIHPLELAEEEGVTLGEVALAFVAAEALHAAPAIWKSIENADVEESARLMLFDQLAIELRVQMADLLRNGWTGMKPSEVVAALVPGMKRVSAEVDALLLGETRRHNEGFAVRLAEAGVPKAIIGAVVGIAKLDGAIGVVTLAKRIKVDELALARAFTLIGAELGLDWAQGAAMQLTPSDPWERLLAAGLARDFQTMRLDFLAKIADKNPEKAVLHWLDVKGPAVTRFRDMTNRAHHAALPSTAMLAQIAGQARQLLA